MATFELQGPDGQTYEVDAPDAQAAVAALAKLTSRAPTQKNSVNLLTDQAMAAYAAGNDAEGKRLLTEANRAAIDSGAVPDGFVADPQTGGMLDIQNDPTIPQGSGVSTAFGAMQGLGYDFGDEAIGGISALAGDDPRFMMERARETQRRAQQNDPLLYGGANIAGGVASSLSLGKALGLGPAMQGTLAQRTVAGAGLGFGEGALAGAGAGEGMGDRLKSAGTYGAIGAGIGAVAPSIIAAIGKGFDKVSGVAASMRSAPSEIRASQALEVALKRSGYTADQIDEMIRQAAAEGQPQFTVADAMGNAGQRALSGVARQPSDGRAAIAEALTQRQGGQGNRLSGFLADALDAPDTAAARVDALTRARSATANAAYDAARAGAGPVDIRGALQVIDDRIGPMVGSGIADDAIGTKLAGYRGRLATSNSPKFPGANVELSDFDKVLALKQQVGDDIGAAIRAGRNNEARELGKFQSALDTALEGASDGYRAANDGFAKASRAIDAVDAGKAATSSRVRAPDTVSNYSAMPGDQQSAFRAGYADPLIARIDASAPGVNKARPLLSEKTAAELGAMANDPALLSRQIGRENTMFETANAALGGSKTADNLADSADVSRFDVGPLMNLLTGNIRSAAMQAGPAMINSLQGRNTATRDLIAKMLMGSDMKGAIAPALAAAEKAGPRRALIEALVRSLPRPTN